MRDSTAFKLAVKALQKEARKEHARGFPYLCGQVKEEGTEYHRAAEKYLKLNEAITILDSMSRQKKMF